MHTVFINLVEHKNMTTKNLVLEQIICWYIKDIPSTMVYSILITYLPAVDQSWELKSCLYGNDCFSVLHAVLQMRGILISLKLLLLFLLKGLIITLLSPYLSMAGLQCHAIKNKNRNHSIN